MYPGAVRNIIRQMQEDFCNGNLDAVYRNVSDDFVFHRAPFPATKGKLACRESDAALLKAFTNNYIEIHEIIVEHDTAMMHYTWTALHVGATPSLNIPASQKTIVISGCMVYHFKNDVIVEQWDYTDMLGMMQQMGVVPMTA